MDQNTYIIIIHQRELLALYSTALEDLPRHTQLREKEPLPGRAALFMNELLE